MNDRLTQLKAKVSKHRNVLILAAITLPVIAAQGKNIWIFENFITKKGLMTELVTGFPTTAVE